MTSIQQAVGTDDSSSRSSTLAAIALVVSPVLAVAALAMFPDTSDEIAMVQGTQWAMLWLLTLAASVLFAVGVTLVFGARIGTAHGAVSTGIAFAWLTVALVGLMYALNVPAARLLVTADASAVLPVDQQQGALDIIEAVSIGIQPLTVAFLGGAVAVLGRVMTRTETLSARLGQAGQVLGAVAVAFVTVHLIAPGVLGYGFGSLVTALLYDLLLVWGLALGISVLRAPTSQPVSDEATA